MSPNYRSSSPRCSAGWVVLLVKALLNESRSILFCVIFLQRLSSTFHRVLSHFLGHIDIFLGPPFRSSGLPGPLQWSPGGGADKAHTQRGKKALLPKLWCICCTGTFKGGSFFETCCYLFNKYLLCAQLHSA